MSKKYKYLSDINFPSDLKKLSSSQLKILAEEVRSEMIDAVSETGGHLGAEAHPEQSYQPGDGSDGGCLARAVRGSVLPTDGRQRGRP